MAHAAKVERGQILTLVCRTLNSCPSYVSCFRMSASYFGQHSGLQGFRQSDLLDCRVERTMSCVGSAGFMWVCQLQRDSRQSCPSAGAQNSSSVHLGIGAYAQVVITRHERDVVSFCKWGSMFCRVVRQPHRSGRTLLGRTGEAGPGERAAVWAERETSCRWLCLGAAH